MDGSRTMQCPRSISAHSLHFGSGQHQTQALQRGRPPTGGLCTGSIGSSNPPGHNGTGVHPPQELSQGLPRGPVERTPPPETSDYGIASSRGHATTATRVRYVGARSTWPKIVPRQTQPRRRRDAAAGAGELNRARVPSLLSVASQYLVIEIHKA